METNLGEAKLKPISPEKEQNGAIRVLVVEDDQDVTKMLKAVIEPEEFNAVFVQSKEEALVALEEANKLGEPKDLVLTDKGLLGDKDGGFEVARKARECGTKHCILYTASSKYDVPEEKLRLNDVDELVEKSAGPRALMQRLNAARNAIIAKAAIVNPSSSSA